MKALSIVTVAILLGLGGAAMANDSGENHQDNTNTTGANPFMPEFSTPASPYLDNPYYITPNDQVGQEAFAVDRPPAASPRG